MLSSFQLENQILDLLSASSLPAESIYYLLLCLANKVQNALLEQKLNEQNKIILELQQEINQESQEQESGQE